MSITGVTSILQGAGLTGSALSSAVGSIIGLFNTTKSQVKAALNGVLQASNDPVALGDAVTKLAEVPNLPSNIALLVPALRAAATPAAVAQIVATMQSELNS